MVELSTSEISTEYFINKFYGMTTKEFMGKYRLEKPAAYLGKSEILNYHNYRNDISFAVTHNFGGYISSDLDTLVIGGPCISDCLPYPTLEAAIEIMNILSLSKMIGSNSIIYVDVEEEKVKDTSIDWSKVGDNLERLARKCSKLVDYDRYAVVRTDDSEVAGLVKRVSASIGDFYSEDFLAQLYNFKPNTGGEKQDSMTIATRDTLATYIPGFIRAVTGERNKILVAENSNQVKAVNAAIDYWNFTNPSEPYCGPFQLVHIPVPSTTGEKRMYRSFPRNKIFLTRDSVYVRKQISKSSPESIRFWKKSLPAEVAKEFESPDGLASLIYNLYDFSPVYNKDGN